MICRDYTPREYQPIITNHIVDVPRCAVWAGMGLGKSVATLTALDMLFLAGESHPVLIVGPLRVARRTWPTDAKKWNHLRHVNVMPLTGTEIERRMAMKLDASVYTINGENIEWLVNHWGDRWPYRTVVWDEATRLAGFRLKQGAARPRALARIAHTHIKRFIELTGTPAPNGLVKLWGQLWFLDAGQRLGRTFESFRQRWFQKSFDGYSVEPLPYTNVEIQDRIRDLCLAIDAKDYFDLDEPIVNNIEVDLPPKARIKYNEMEKDMFTELEGREVEAFSAAARTQKCLQLANGAAYVNAEGEDDPRSKEWRVVHDAKLEALESCIENANGMPQIVSYEFKSDAIRIMKAFPNSVRLDDDRGFDTFMKGKTDLGLAHPKSMGHGVDGLQDVTNIITHFGHNWDLELYSQINERIGPVRQMQSGHERPVYINHIIARDTTDEMVMARRETKRTVQEVLIDAMKRKREKNYAEDLC